MGHPGAPTTIELTVDGRDVHVHDDGSSLLDVLREQLHVTSVKDGCAPQGQCGCCTVHVDGQPRVACVTPVRRLRGRSVTTLDGLAAPTRSRWAQAICATGASQCGFCTPGIVMRLAALRSTAPGATHDDVRRALRAHLCRCTGWQTLLEAWDALDHPPPDVRDLEAAARRAELEGGVPQMVGPEVALGAGGFAADTAPAAAEVAVPADDGTWVHGPSLAAARAKAAKVQGRRTTAPLTHPLGPPPGEWAATLCTTWVEPAYLEPDASWCVPGGEPASPVANGGAFGGKAGSVVADAARALADELGCPVRLQADRETVVRRGAKRPPVAGGANADGSGTIRVARTLGVAEAIASVAPGLRVEEIDVVGPPTSVAMRAAGWAEAVALLAGARGSLGAVRGPGGGEAEAEVDDDGVRIRVAAGDPLDEVVLRSYCIGAAHMALGLVRSEGIAVDADGVPLDLTIRSFGVLRAVDTPPVTVEIDDGGGPPVNGSDAVFAAVAAAAWLADGCPPRWPTRR